MFSNDKNVETIAQLFKVLKRYFGLQAEYTKLSIVEIIVRLLTAVALIAVFVTLFLIALIYFSFAAAIAIGEALGCALWGYLIVGFAYIILFLIMLMLRKVIIEKPLVRFLSSLLLS
ncbi:hypothetical protein [Prevotella amnii]|jgi:hypothetical protein|uniref:Phage holin family protein n=3 Tax=Prevotella amnii TaxID=419005 RepID=A0A096B1A0_9BACT|nr:hypothetical protein [Prevotella amnii]EFN91121.1 hypothetical protein HMPREF9018_0328 [Prevotella amnii CRIS 21A-A]KGF52716.1 hypothetical protein HMPREF9302_02360 [Prevotella amnii DNF00058]KXB80098.1 hypothetical protein HMPREF1860_00384 [Prevotella amnii]